MTCLYSLWLLIYTFYPLLSLNCLKIGGVENVLNSAGNWHISGFVAVRKEGAFFGPFF